MKNTLTTLLFLCCFLTAFSQLDTLFWFAAPEVSINASFDRPIVFRISTVDQASTVTIDQPANGGFVPIVYVIPAGATQTVDLTPWIDQIEIKPPNTVLDYGLRITATTPVTAYYEVVSASCNCNPEIFALKGQNAMGTDFFVPTQHFLDNSAAYAPLPYNSFDIVATEDNTTVTITPSQNVVGHAAGVPYNILLNAGQTYSATATSQLAMQHLFGSRVTSTQPIAITVKDDLLAGTVFGGCADLGGDQSIPLSIIGTEYIIVRGFLNAPYDQVFVLATEDNTTISVNGAVVTTINEGESYNYAIGAALSAYIETSNPVYVMQMSGFGCEVGLSILPPIVCTGSQRVAFGRSNAESLFLIVLVEAGGEGNFELNGNPAVITPTDFSFVPGTANGWMFAQITIPTATVPAGGSGAVTNSTNFFHLGMIHGSSSGGCRYGYFSDFAKYKYQINADANTFCLGDDIELVTNTLPGATYQWTGPNGFTGVGDTLIIPNSQYSDTGMYIVYGNLPNECELLPDTINISIIEAPPAPQIFTNGPVCENDSLLFWNQVASPLTFDWTDNLGNPLPQNDTIFVSPQVTGNISVNLTASLGSCVSPITTIQSQVFADPDITYTGPSEVCGSAVDMDATVTPDATDPVDLIEWHAIPTLTQIGTGSTVSGVQSSIAPSIQDSFMVSAISANGCIDVDTFVVDFLATPETDFSWTDLCDASSISFQNNSSWQGNPQVGDVLSYVLYFGDATSSTDPNSTHAYSPTGTYTASLVVTGSNGCQDSLALPVLVPSSPQTNFLIDDGCGETEFSADVNSGNLAIDGVLWEVEDLVSNNQLSFSQNISTAGHFVGTLTLFGSNDCVYEYPFNFTVIPSITLDQLVVPNVITANNDGVNDELLIDTLFTVCHEYKMDILNRWGNNVFSTSNNSSPFRGNDKNGKALLPGVYFYVIRTDEGEKHGNITVVRE